MTNLDIDIKKQRHYFANKGPPSQGYGFSSGHVWMWELDYKESWAPKNQCFWTVVLEKTLESPLDCREIQPVHPKGNHSWIFTGRTDVEAETPILWPPDAKNWLIGKDPDAGKDWRWEEKGTTEDEMVGWYHQLNGHVFEYTLEVGNGQGGLGCCGSPGHKESFTTEWLNWTDHHLQLHHIDRGLLFIRCPPRIIWPKILQWSPWNFFSFLLMKQSCSCLRAYGVRNGNIWMTTAHPNQSSFLSI